MQVLEQPKLMEWLSLPASSIAEIVREKHVTVMLSIDGTRRHFLINHPSAQINDFQAYTTHMSNAYVHLYDLLFSLGVQAIATPNLYPPNFQRGAAELQRAVSASGTMLLKPPFSDCYQRWDVKARLYGDFDFAPAAAPVRDELVGLAEDLRQLKPDGERTLLYGYCADSFANEQIAHSVDLYHQLGRIPTEAEVRAACYPDIEHFDVYIGAGWMRVGMVLPPLVSTNTDLYFLSCLVLDANEEDFRRILYDHLFLRWAQVEDNASYTADDLNELTQFYEANHKVVGLGKLAGPKLWYPV